MRLVHTLLMLVSIAIGLVAPTMPPAMAMPEMLEPAMATAAHADCPHEAIESHEAVEHGTGRAAVLPLCCYGMVTPGYVAESETTTGARVPSLRLLPISDALPRSAVAGPDTPPPRI